MCEYLTLAEKYVDNKKITGIRLSTRPDYITEEILDILGKYSVTNIELGAQSLDGEVLKRANRGHSVFDVENAARLINARGITLGLQMMIGLPKDNYEKSIKTAKRFVELGAKETRIYPTVVLKGTRLAKMLEEGDYVPEAFEQIIDTAADCFSIFFENGVKVLRIGLQNSKELKENAVGGFYHEALGEKVYSRVIRRNAQRAGEGTISYNSRFLSKVTGQKKENMPYFENFTLCPDDSLTGVTVNGKYVLTI
ncbi:MAG: radical SAM protein [Clostridia bacterium]|nr:radical SAM protein [Clostridia bacterium]